MKKISFYINSGFLMRRHDAAYISDQEDIPQAVAEAVIGSISTDVEFEIGGKKVFLAMLLDPDHWSSDWEERGVEDVDEFLAGLVQNT